MWKKNKTINLKLYEIAKSQYKEIKAIIDSFSGSFEELYTQLDGFNLEENERFDANYGVLVITVYNKDGFVLYEYVDVWDDEKQKPICEGKNIKDL